MSCPLGEVVYNCLSFAEEQGGNTPNEKEQVEALMTTLIELCDSETSGAVVEQKEKKTYSLEDSVQVATSLGFVSIGGDSESSCATENYSDVLRFLSTEAIVSSKKLEAEKDNLRIVLDGDANRIREGNDEEVIFETSEDEINSVLCSIRDALIEDYEKHSQAQALNLKLLAQSFEFNVRSFTSGPNPYADEILECLKRLETQDEWNLEAILGSKDSEGSDSTSTCKEVIDRSDALTFDPTLFLSSPLAVKQEEIDSLLEPSFYRRQHVQCEEGQISAQISHDLKLNRITASPQEDESRLLSSDKTGTDSMMEARRSMRISRMPRWHTSG